LADRVEREPSTSSGDDAPIVGPVPIGRDRVEYDHVRRRVLWSLPSGLYVVGSRAQLEGTWRWNLMTANLVAQVAVDPKLVAVSIDRLARTCELVSAGKVFAVSLLDREDRSVVRRFVKPVDDLLDDGHGHAVSMNDEPVQVGATGSPILQRALAWLDCEVRERVDLGSHVLFIGEVVDVGGRATADGRGRIDNVLRMEDTRMNYGG
jgi:flavin reductase (DIM6/NTAB) family NADH-FMN oxidoreductase RutF